MKALQIGNNYFMMLGLFTTTQSFYFSILEEYYVGGLYIGIMNAVTDCSIIVVLIYLFAGVYSNQFFTQKITFNVGANEYTLSMAVLLCLFLIFT